MRYALTAIILSLALFGPVSAPTAAAAGSGSLPNPQVAYEWLGGKSNKLVVSDENGSNASTLYSSAQFFRFDLAPRSQRQIALIDDSTTPALRLLTYTQTGTGGFAASSVAVLNTGADAPRRGSNVDFSPDGSKIAYACDSNGVDTEHLCVFDLGTNTVTVWGSDSFYWDFAWFRGGAAIAYSTEDSDGITRLHEIDGPGATPQVVFTTKSDLYLDASRTNPNALVLNYHDANGNALTGLWQDGSFIDPNLTNSTVSFFGELSCNDSELAYLGPPNNSPDWYIRDLGTTQTRVFSKTYYRWVQFWPTCS
jgi:hypothetical protein